MGSLIYRVIYTIYLEWETFKVGRTLQGIIDWSTAQDTTWAHTVLLATLFGQAHFVDSVLMVFLYRISKLRIILTRATTWQPMLGKYFFQWIRIILDNIWVNIRNNETVLTQSLQKFERHLSHISLKITPNQWRLGRSYQNWGDKKFGKAYIASSLKY